MSTTTASGTIEHVDPATLTIATNVRTDVNLGKEFTDSIRANGVLQPIVATRDTEGALHVRYGQRRTRAAQEVGLSTVPVFIVDANDEDTASRIIEQLVENEHRDALRDHERVEAWKQLEIEGLSVAQIAKRTGTTRDTIKTGLAVAASVVVISGEHRLDTADDLIHEIASALGVPDRGDALAARLAADLAAAGAEISAVAPDAASDRPRMLFLYVRGNANIYYIFGRDSGAESLIEAVGGVDVAGAIGWEGMKPMNAEALVATQPDVLVMMTDELASVDGVDGMLERIPALAQTPAGAHRRVIDMADADILSFGPRSAEIVRALARALYAPAA